MKLLLIALVLLVSATARANEFSDSGCVCNPKAPCAEECAAMCAARGRPDQTQKFKVWADCMKRLKPQEKKR